MTLKSGLNASIGFGDETTWGTAVTPTVWVPLVSESLQSEIARLDSEAIITGQRVLRSQQWSLGAETVSGDIGLELNDQSKGLLLKHMFGGSSTTGPFSAADLSGLGLTVQVGIPDTAGTVNPKTFAGCKVSSWELGCVAGEIATLGLTVAGRHEIGYRTVADGVTTNTSTTITSATAVFSEDDVDKPISGTGIPANTTIAAVASATSATLSAAATATATGVTFTLGLALTSPTFASNIAPMTYVGGEVLIAGSAYRVNEITVGGDNGLDDGRPTVGDRSPSEPLEAGLRVYTGSISSEYFSDAAYRRFRNQTESAMVLTIARGSKSIVVTTNIRYDGETPQVEGRGVVGQTLPFTCVGTTTDASAITVTLDET